MILRTLRLTTRDGTFRAWQEIEREAFEEALRHHGGNVAAVARALGISPVTVYKRVERYGLAREEFGIRRNWTTRRLEGVATP